MALRADPGTIQVWSDVGCPWSHAVVWRLWDARRRLGLERRVRFAHHPSPLELFNSEPTPRPKLEAEWPTVRDLAPRAGWEAWSAPDHAWPVTMLPPLEAVQAAKDQSLTASEELDRALRRAFFAESRCISLRHVILEVASECETVDLAPLSAVLDDGRARRRLFDDWEVAKGEDVRGSAHLFLPDGTNAQNPGMRFHWEGGSEGSGALVVDGDDPTVYDDLVRRAAG